MIAFREGGLSADYGREVILYRLKVEDHILCSGDLRPDVGELLLREAAAAGESRTGAVPLHSVIGSEICCTGGHTGTSDKIQVTAEYHIEYPVVGNSADCRITFYRHSVFSGDSGGEGQ